MQNEGYKLGSWCGNFKQSSDKKGRVEKFITKQAQKQLHRPTPFIDYEQTANLRPLVRSLSRLTVGW